MHDDDVGDDDDDLLTATLTDLPSGLHVTYFLLKEDLKFSLLIKLSNAR